MDDLAQQHTGTITFRDVGSTNPGTLAGRFMRRFWHPVMASAALLPGAAKPLRIMGEDFAIYRGQSGAACVIDQACPHRAMPMHVGWVEGDEIRCFYHGWKFDGAGQCTEQPAERPNFCAKIRTGAYPTREYLGLVFCYFGEGDPPDFPRYPEWERPDIIINDDSYVRACHFFNNLENAADKSHIAFAHRDALGAWDEATDGPTISAEESVWGVTFTTTRPSGPRTVSQFGMPNIYHTHAVPDDPEVKYRHFIAWWVPIDDDRHIQFTLSQQPANAPGTPGYQARRAERRARMTQDREPVARAILAGKQRLEDVDASHLGLIFLQDDVAQIGVGPVATRPPERLGRGDVGLILQRKIWTRELARLAAGQPLKNWRYDAEALPVRAEY